MRFLESSVLLLLLALLGCSAPEVPSAQWYKGNLHTHSYWSDGDDFPEVILDWYKLHDYDFVALSDHNTIAEGEKWVTIKEDSIYQAGFDHYLSTYGEDWVTYRKDSGQVEVRLKTFAEYKGLIEEAGEFLVIRSEEISDDYEGKPIHLNATNIQEYIAPQGGNSVVDVMQNNIDAVIKQQETTGTPMIPHINHPNFHYAITVEDMIALRGERFFEVYNGHPQVHIMGDTLHMSTEEMWDQINISYLANDKPIMYGLATDDAHHYHRKGRSWSNAGRGWIYVKSDALNAASIVDAIEKGEFYASTGVELVSIDFQNNTLSVEVNPKENTTYSVAFMGCRNGASEAEVLSVEEGVEASFEVPEDILFIRCKVTSSELESEPAEYDLYQSAWTQPFVPGQDE